MNLSRRRALASVAALPVGALAPVGPMLPNNPAAARRVIQAVCELLEAGRTAAADPRVLVDDDVRRAIAIYLRLIDCSEDQAYTAITPLQ